MESNKYKRQNIYLLYEHNLNTQNYFKDINYSADEMKLINESDIIYLQMDNAKYL